MNLSKPESKSVPAIFVAISKQGLIICFVDEIQFPCDLFEVYNPQLREGLTAAIALISALAKQW